MLIVYFPSNFDVDNSVDKLKSYTQVKIEIVDKPNKTIYYIGESFEKEGMKVVATYEDNTKKEITTYYIV